MGLVRISGLPGSGARYYATRVAATESAAGRRVGWLIGHGDDPGIVDLEIFGHVDEIPTGLDLLVVDEMPVDEGRLRLLAHDVVVVSLS